MRKLALLGSCWLVLACGSKFEPADDAEPQAARDWREHGGRPWPEFDAQRDRIEAELARGSLPMWAGTFRASTYGGCDSDSVAFTLAPTEGIAWSRIDGIGDRKNRGRVRAVDGNWIEIEWELRADSALQWSERGRWEPELSERLWLSTWGDREFLVPECDLARFVNLVNSGKTLVEPLFAFRWLPGRAPDGASPQIDLARVDQARPDGSPSLPEPWASRVRAEPLYAVVASAERPVLVYRSGGLFDFGADRTRFLAQFATLDRGAAAGVFEGMEVYVAERRRGGVVTECRELDAKVRFVFDARDRHVAAFGLPLAPGSVLRSQFRP